jgi:hypothetical protein
LVYIAHPKLREGYNPEDMKVLTNYDGIEVLNNYRTSLEYWDSALSAGNYITILSNDDAHDISNPDEIGHHCTFINSPSLSKNEIIQALKAGKSFGARIFRPEGEAFVQKIERISVLPVIKNVTVTNDTILIFIDSVASQIRFIGQFGKLLKSEQNVNKSWYFINENDTYIRIETIFSDGSCYFLNPICRYDGKTPNKIEAPNVNFTKTLLLRISGFLLIVLLIAGIYFLLHEKLPTE